MISPTLYLTLKALHIIFIVTWFAGLFYMVRLFIYNTEAHELPEQERNILHRQFKIMLKRLWYGITWPSAIITLILGGSLWYQLQSTPPWLSLKFIILAGLILYHLSLQKIFNEQHQSKFQYTSFQLRLWNEVATLFLFCIVFLAIFKQSLSLLWALLGFVFLTGALLAGIALYRRRRMKS